MDIFGSKARPVDLEIHKFSKLGQNEIRLLHLHHSRRPDVYFHLEQHKIELAPKFCALSYCWGKSTQTERVFCEDQRGRSYLSVTTNLRTILSNIKDNKLSEGLPLWIDQICINQDDNSERAHQVKLMSGIYSTAQKTLIHLGNEPPRSKKDSLNFLDVVGNISSWKKRLFSMDGAPSYEDWVRETNRSKDFEQLYGLLQAPWFQRLWVVQEFALSRNCSIIFGTKAVSWQDFYAGMQYPELCRQANSSSNKFAPPVAYTNAIGILEELDAYAKAPSGTERELYVLIDSFARRGTSDPHDKVFALLGLAKGADGLIEEIDYDEPYWTTLTRAVNLMIQQSSQRWHSNRFEFLHFADPEQATNPQHGPSWIPNLMVDSTQRLRLANNKDFSRGLQQFKESGMQYLPMRGVYLDVLETQLGDAHAHNLIRTDTHLLTSYNPECRREWLTKSKLHIEVHQACEEGDTLYALDGLHHPCILRGVKRRDGMSEYIFLGCVSSPTFKRGSGTIHFRDNDITAENFARAQYGEQPVTDTIYEYVFRESIWEPWMRREDKVYPFNTEDLLLV